MKQKKVLKILKPLLIVIGIIGVGWGVYLAYLTTQFHIVKTDPKLSSVSTIAPYLRVYFNNELNPSSLKYDDPNGIVGSVDVKDKVITFHFEKNLEVNYPYTITIQSIRNLGTDVITNRKLSFNAKKLDFNSISKEQQKTLVDRQDQPQYEPDFINYQDFDTLLNYGVSSGQLSSIKNSLYDYSNTINKQYWKMQLLPKTVRVKNHDSTASDGLERLDFSLVLSGKEYAVHGEYEILYDSVHLQIRNSSGELVYDSANVEHAD